MTFLDTNVWIELLGVKTPRTEREKKQAEQAGRLLLSITEQEETIITCKEQILEVISAVEKVKHKEINRERKQNSLGGIETLKKFRQYDEFAEVQELCATIVDDILHFAIMKNVGDYGLDYIKDIVNRLNFADINDCIYYDYCLKNGIDLHSFDKDLANLGEHDKLHIMEI